VERDGDYGKRKSPASENAAGPVCRTGSGLAGFVTRPAIARKRRGGIQSKYEIYEQIARNLCWSARARGMAINPIRMASKQWTKADL
jgi:hypothetical protein